MSDSISNLSTLYTYTLLPETNKCNGSLTVNAFQQRCPKEAVIQAFLHSNSVITKQTLNMHQWELFSIPYNAQWVLNTCINATTSTSLSNDDSANKRSTVVQKCYTSKVENKSWSIKVWKYKVTIWNLDFFKYLSECRRNYAFFFLSNTMQQLTPRKLHMHF